MKAIKGCDYLRSGSTLNPLVEFVKTYVPQLPSCPVEGAGMQIRNLSFQPHMAGYWPDGFYQGTFKLSDEQDENIFAFRYDQHIRNTDDINEFK